jgi:hypothetical protein
MQGPFHSWLPCLPRAKEVLYVVRHERRWKIKRNNVFTGPYIGRKDALQSAIRDAHKLGPHGGAQVYAEVAKDEFELAWTYGLDPTPPECVAAAPRPSVKTSASYI